jgi:CubicO group peptidase (beta-lactamase class C family)
MTYSKHALLAIALVALVHSAPIAAQITSPEIDALVEDAMKKFDVAGVAVGVVKDGKIIHTRGYGVRSIETKDAVNEHTNFAIASNTKAFTAAALAILVDEGKLSWEDPVKDHIPEFKMYNAYVTENFNIADLLTHRSGLGLGIGDLMFTPDGSDFTIDDIISSFQYFEAQSAFRTKYDYDNLLYKIAGEVVGRVSGTRWEDFVKARIFAPLKMNNSYTELTRARKKKNLATPHSTENSPIRTISHFEQPKGSNGAAGGILSNVDDLCQWLLVQLNEGRYGKGLDKRLFSTQRQREMWSIHTTMPVKDNPRYRTHFQGYGLGWNLKDINGNMSVFHGGLLPGMLSRTVLIPDLELGVVVLTNTSSGGGVWTAVSKTIVDSYLGLDDYGWTDKVLAQYQSGLSEGDEISAQVWATVDAAKGTPVDVDSYLGVYQDKWFGNVEVFLKGKKLWMKSYRSPKLNGEMQFYKANAFAIKWEYQDMNADAFAIFALDEEGRSQSIKMKGISPNIDFSFDFQDLDLKRLEGN